MTRSGGGPGTPSRRAAPAAVALSLLATSLWATAATGANAPREAAFPEATPESVGISSAALRRLADEVEDYIDRDMVVGAELLVIKDRQTVLHEAFGWRDREAAVPMERETLFNIRSMTKPITGAAAQILIDEGKLALDDRVAAYLPGFDNEASGEITVEQLLTHTSGLPLATVTSVDQFASLQAMAAATGEGGPEFEPGSKFWYSDAGADALGAVVEVVSGEPLADFVEERLLEPLAMTDTSYPGGDATDARLARTASLYVGRVGGWTPFWGPDDDPFYPYAWGSQSLYSSPRDYARFLAMWLDQGVAGETRVLTPDAVDRMLTPVAAMATLGSDAPYPTLFPGLTAYHGQMAVLHVDGRPVDGMPPPDAEPVIVGYSGSDGTIAWAWPERDLMILYFTQSRGGSSPIRLEAEISRLLLDPSDEPGQDVPAAYGDYLGTYTADFGAFRNEPFEVIWRDDELALDIPSQFIIPLDGTAGDDETWTLRDVSDAAISFERGTDGAVTGLRLRQGTQVFELPKGALLPQAEMALGAEDVRSLLGWYREEGTGREVEVVLHDGRLALRIPEAAAPLELYAPDADGAWRVRLDPSVAILFDGDASRAGSYEVRSPAGTATFMRIDGPSDVPASTAGPQ